MQLAPKLHQTNAGDCIYHDKNRRTGYLLELRAGPFATKREFC
jgi:hypothetical protein